MYVSALRHILTTVELPITVLEDLDGTEDLGNIRQNEVASQFVYFFFVSLITFVLVELFF